MQREAEWLAVEALRQHDILYVVSWEVLCHERSRTDALRGCGGWLTVKRNDTRPVWKREQR